MLYVAAFNEGDISRLLRPIFFTKGNGPAGENLLLLVELQ